MCCRWPRGPLASVLPLAVGSLSYCVAAGRGGPELVCVAAGRRGPELVCCRGALSVLLLAEGGGLEVLLLAEGGPELVFYGLWVDGLNLCLAAESLQQRSHQRRRQSILPVVLQSERHAESTVTVCCFCFHCPVTERAVTRPLSVCSTEK